MELPELSQQVASMNQRILAIEGKVDMLSGAHVHLVQSEISPTGEVIEGSHAEIIAAEGPPPGMSVSEWITGMKGSPGIVVDDVLARSTPCIRIELGEGARPLVYSKGVIGALDEEQANTYCQQGYVDREVTPKQRARLTTMKAAAKACSSLTEGMNPEARMPAYFTCVAQELKANGQEAW